MSASTRKAFGVKSCGLKAAVSAGAEITPEMLAKINGFALKDLTAEEIYVRKFLFCHSAIDRDNERFPEPLLDDFVTTFPGKSFLFAHDRDEYLPLGLFFDASAEMMTPEQFKGLTGEDPLLPEGSTSVKIVWAWAYMLREHRKEIIDNIDAGVYRHVSIGFAAADIRPVKKDINGPTLFWEYVGPGETREGSLVWLGAQPGATAQKTMKDQKNHITEETSMKTIIALLVGLGLKSITDTATEDQVAAGVKSLIDEKDATIKTLEPDAVLGKAYREKTVDSFVAAKQKLGEVADTEEAKKSLKDAAGRFEFTFLEAEVKHLEKRVAEKFPSTGQLDGDDRRDKSADGGSTDNPLIPKDK